MSKETYEYVEGFKAGIDSVYPAKPPRTHCVKGHELKASNLVKSKLISTGIRYCKLCWNEYMRERYKRLGGRG